MNRLPYQSHYPGQKSMVDSFEKLERLKIPKNLKGKSFLDIGCNEGFFCNVAIERGASRVVGIDNDKNFINNAKEIYGNKGIIFLHEDWYNLPNEKFDIILWASAMHYELDPLKVLMKIANILNDDGLFILECGIAPGNSKKYETCN